MGKRSSYFRHSFNAHRDVKIMKLLGYRNGLAAVGFYFILLELYGASIADDDGHEKEQNMHLRLIANATGLRADSARTMLQLCTDCELINIVLSKSNDTEIKLEVPNFLKYYGKYSKAEPMKVPNKRKEKESKLKESKGKGLDPSLVFDAWNLICGEVLPKAKALSKKRIGHINSMIKNIEGLEDIDGWKLYFEQCSKNLFLCGGNDRGWKCDFDWVINSNNAIKISEGRYDGLGPKSNANYVKRLYDENPFRGEDE